MGNLFFLTILRTGLGMAFGWSVNSLSHCGQMHLEFSHFKKIYILFINLFLVTLGGMWDFSSPTRD